MCQNVFSSSVSGNLQQYMQLIIRKKYPEVKKHLVVYSFKSQVNTIVTAKPFV